MNQEPLQVGDIAYVLPYNKIVPVRHRLLQVVRINTDTTINCSWVNILPNGFGTTYCSVVWAVSDLRKLTEIEKALYL